MRKLIVVTLLFLLNCSSNRSAEMITADTDSVQSESDSLEIGDESLSGNELIETDSGVYIGPMYTFSLTQEYYTPIYFLKDEIDEESRQKLLHALDSVLYEGEDITRSRLPLAIARKNFNLVGLDTISIFSGKGTRLYRGRLVRIEYIDSFIESEFVAVFKPIGKVSFAEEVGYCVSGGRHSLKEMHRSWRVIEDQSLTDKLLKTFSVDSQDVWRVTHTQLIEDSAIYSTVALNGDSSFMAKTENGKSIILKSLTDNTSFLELYPIHFRSEDKPVFLAKMGINESDAIWVSLLMYLNGEYRFMPRDRTAIK